MDTIQKIDLFETEARLNSLWESESESDRDALKLANANALAGAVKAYGAEIGVEATVVVDDDRVGVEMQIGAKPAFVYITGHECVFVPGYQDLTIDATCEILCRWIARAIEKERTRSAAEAWGEMMKKALPPEANIWVRGALIQDGSKAGGNDPEEVREELERHLNAARPPHR